MTRKRRSLISGKFQGDTRDPRRWVETQRLLIDRQHLVGSVMKCPKCGYARQASDDDTTPAWQCPSCGVAYIKAEQLQTTPNAELSSHSSFTQGASSRNSRVVLLVVAAFLLAVPLLGLVFMVPRGDPAPGIAAMSAVNSGTSAEQPDADRVSRDERAPLLKREIATIEEDLRRTEAEIAKYTGGLIKTVLESTAAIQRQTLEMLRQRDRSWTFGIGLRYTVDGRVFEPPSDAQALLIQLEREIADTARSIAESEAEAAKYSGGLIRATTLAAGATSRQTLAMLEQRRLAIQFGLPQYVGFQSGSADPDRSAEIRPTLPATAEPQKREWEIVEIGSRVTERNDIWWRYAWKLTLRNTGETARRFSATIEFQDSDGFVVDSTQARDLVLSGGEQKSFTGYKLVSVPGARNVERTAAKVQER